MPDFTVIRTARTTRAPGAAVPYGAPERVHSQWMLIFALRGLRCRCISLVVVFPHQPLHTVRVFKQSSPPELGFRSS